MYVICIRVVSPLDYLRVNCRRLVSLSLNTQLCFTKDKKKKKKQKKQSRYGQHTKKTLLRMSSGLWAAQRHGLAGPFCGAFLPLGVSVSLFVRPSLSPLPPPHSLLPVGGRSPQLTALVSCIASSWRRPWSPTCHLSPYSCLPEPAGVLRIATRSLGSLSTHHCKPDMQARSGRPPRLLSQGATSLAFDLCPLQTLAQS